MNFAAQPAARVSQALRSAEEPIMIETDQQLSDMSEKLRSCTVVGLDTEFVRERTYRADLGLLQVSDGVSAWLIDPLKVDDLDPLVVMLDNTKLTKIIHSGSEDFEVIRNTLGVVPAGVIDSQIACAMLGQSLQLGYHHAVKWLFDIEVEKDQTRSNWLKRPLTQAQCRYAALDVVLLPMMVEQLKEKLVSLGRWGWLTEEVGRMARNSAEPIEPMNAWQRIRGAGSLSGNERKTLQALTAWREVTASQKNLARGFVVKDISLMAMARHQPDSIEDFDHIDDLHPKAIARYGNTWLQTVQQAHKSPEVTPLPQLEHSHRSTMNALRKKVSDTAEALNVDAALLASRKQLENLIFEFEDSGEVPERFSGWRQEVITNDLLEILDS